MVLELLNTTLNRRISITQYFFSDRLEEKGEESFIFKFYSVISKFSRAVVHDSNINKKIIPEFSSIHLVKTCQ